jgi:kynureninase
MMYDNDKDVYFAEVEIILKDRKERRGIQVSALSEIHAEACAEMHIHNKRDIIGDIKRINVLRIRKKPEDPDYKIFNFIKWILY